ncbi:MAG TPA: hypothetical protein VK864_01450 [Longimicrobiales bacterium]|nr:hypothetical protein [Longimicrobiales bacterium]
MASRVGARLTVAATMVLSGCAARAASVGPVDPAAEQAASAATALKRRLRIVFEWTLQDRDARFSGEGATRIEPPYQARLDLFGPRGEAYLSAALVDFELRLPPGAPADVLPPPPMLWSVLGVFRAPPSAQLIGVKRDSAQMELQYRAGDETWIFALRGDRLQRAEWQGPAQGRQTVEISSYDARGLPSRVVYRDWRAFRELTVTLSQAYEVDTAFPPETWTPGNR